MPCEKIYPRQDMTALNPNTPGMVLKRLREAKGMTQQTLADKLGKSRTAVAAWEYGRAMSLRSRAAVAKLFNVEPDTLGPPWNPNGARPQYRRRAREEAAYMEELRRLGQPIGDAPSPIAVDPEGARGVVLSSPPPTQPRGGTAMREIPDAEQFDKLVGFWCAMDPANRTRLVHEAWSLSSPGGHGHAATEHSPRGKAQG